MSTLIMTHIEPEPKIAFVVITTESTKLQVQHNSLNELIKWAYADTLTILPMVNLPATD